MKHIIVIIIFNLIFLGSLGLEARAGQMEEGLRYYRENRLDEAKKYFESLAATGKASGDVFYNLGNVHYRLGSLGEAVRQYEKGLKLIPRDADLKANLKFVRQKLAYDGAMAANGPGETIFWPNSLMTLDEMAVGIFILSFLSFLPALLFFFFPAPSLKRTAFVLICLFFYVAAAGVYKYRDESGRKGIVTSRGAHLYPTFLGEGEGIPLPEGMEVRILSVTNAGSQPWIQVADPSDRRGWIPENFVGKI